MYDAESKYLTGNLQNSDISVRQGRHNIGHNIMPLTEVQYKASMQSIQNKYIKLELLNYQFQTVTELSGVAIDGNISIDAKSDIRRTANISLVAKDSSFNVQFGGKIWLDKYIRIFVGISSNLSGQIEWVNCGIYIIDAPKYQYDATTNTLTLSLLDLMAKLTGVRNGYLKGVPVQLKANEPIRKAIIDTLALGGFNSYIIDDPPDPGKIPNDIDLGQGATVFEVLKALRDIYPNYEMYFDTDGVFHYNKIPSGYDSPIIANDDLWDRIVIKETIDVDFQNVKNSIEVYGREHDPAYFSTSTTVSNSTINLTIGDHNGYVENAIYGFTLQSHGSIYNASIRVNSLTTYPVKNDDDTLTIIHEITEETTFCVQFMGSYWRWLGHLQAYGFAEDTNPDSPFYINGTTGKIRLPLFDGEYANCITDDLAQQRAEYELWTHTNLNNTVSMSIVPVYWLDVNVLVERTLARTKEKGKYIIKSLNMGLAYDSSGEVNMMKFYHESPSA